MRRSLVVALFLACCASCSAQEADQPGFVGRPRPDGTCRCGSEHRASSGQDIANLIFAFGTIFTVSKTVRRKLQARIADNAPGVAQ